MKKQYEDPNLELIRINRGDIVSTSGCDKDICYTNAGGSTSDNTKEGQVGGNG